MCKCANCKIFAHFSSSGLLTANLGFTYGKPWVYLRQTPGLLTAKSYNKRTVCYTRAVSSASQYGGSEKSRAVNFYSRNAKIYNVRAKKFNTDITPSKKIVRNKLIPWGTE